MKLLDFAAKNFGRLTEAWNFQGASTALYGKNEAGKTTFIDGLICALFGEPGRGRGTTLGRLLHTRYGDGPFDLTVEFKKSDGTIVASSVKKPEGTAGVPEDIFKDLLVIRGGECRLDGAKGDDFIPAFTRRVLGGGSVDIPGAIDALNGVWLATRKNSKIVKQKLEFEENRDKLTRKLDAAESLGIQTGEKETAEQALKTIAPKKNALEEEANLLKLADACHLKTELEDLGGRWQRLKAESSDAKAPSPSDIQMIEKIESARITAKNEVATLSRLRGTPSDEIKALSEKLETLEKNEKALVDRASCIRLEKAIADLERCEAESAGAKRSTGFPPAARGGIAAVIALLAGAAVFMGSDNPLFGAASALAIGGLSWWALGKISGSAAGTNDNEALERARKYYSSESAAMGTKWADLPPAEAKINLDKEKSREAALHAEQETLGRALDAKKAALSANEDALARAKTTEQTASEDLKSKLSSWGVSTIDDAKEKSVKTKRLSDDIAVCVGAVREKLEEPAVSVEALADKLQARLSAISSETASLPLEWKNLRPKAIGDKATENSRQRKVLDEEESELNSKVLAATSSHARMSGQLGQTPGQIYAELSAANNALANLALWRNAAEEAHAVIGQLAGDTEDSMKSCVKEAVPLFEAMTEGRYADIILKENSLFDEDAIEIKHKTLGERPLPWLSSGAADILWLAMRVALAKRVFPEGGLLVLDEPFLTLDLDRTKSAVKVIFSDASMKDWQIILLTKDDRIADLCKTAGAKRLDLPS